MQDNEGVQNSRDLSTMIFDMCRIKDPLPELDVYLLSLLRELRVQDDAPPSYALIGNILLAAFDTMPMEFDDSWIDIPKTKSEPNSKEYFREIYTLEYVSRDLKVQIAEYYQVMNLKEKEFNSLEEKEQALVRSWKNLDLREFLHRAADMLGDYDEDDEEYTPSDGWLTLHFLLQEGQTRE